MVEKVTEHNTVPAAEPNRFIAEASTLGFIVGRTPNWLETSLGNGQSLVYVGTDVNGAKTYKQVHGLITLTVLND